MGSCSDDEVEFVSQVNSSHAETAALLASITGSPKPKLPADAELRRAVTEMLRSADLESVTPRDVRNALEKQFCVSLQAKMGQLREMMRDFIEAAACSDTEDSEEEEEDEDEEEEEEEEEDDSSEEEDEEEDGGIECGEQASRSKGKGKQLPKQRREKGKERAASSGAGSSAPEGKIPTELWRGLEVADGDVIYACQKDGCPMRRTSNFRWRKWTGQELENGLAHGEMYQGHKWGGLHLYRGKFMCGICNGFRS